MKKTYIAALTCMLLAASYGATADSGEGDANSKTEHHVFATEVPEAAAEATNVQNEGGEQRAEHVDQGHEARHDIHECEIHGHC